MKNEFVTKGIFISVFLHIALGYVLIDGLSMSNIEDFSMPGIFMLFLSVNLATVAVVLLRANKKKGDLIKLQMGQLAFGILVSLSVFLYIQDFSITVYFAIVAPSIILQFVVTIIEIVSKKKTAQLIK